ncbi:accessory factor UbiK family protein [Pelagibacteraceae bacterium]|nr:accessory factor UbiK family protein [Pelagibacteraceae bacterium]
MEKYNKILRNISELIEKGLFTSKDLRKEVESAIKFKVENIASKLNLVSREEFEIQKKMIENVKRDIIKIRNNKKKKKIRKKFKKAKKV